MGKPVSSTLQVSASIPASSFLPWVLASTSSNDEQWCRSMSQTNPLLSKFLCSWCFIAAIESLTKTQGMTQRLRSFLFILCVVEDAWVYVFTSVQVLWSREASDLPGVVVMVVSCLIWVLWTKLASVLWATSPAEPAEPSCQALGISSVLVWGSLAYICCITDCLETYLYCYSFHSCDKIPGKGNI